MISAGFSSVILVKHRLSMIDESAYLNIAKKDLAVSYKKVQFILMYKTISGNCTKLPVTIRLMSWRNQGKAGSTGNIRYWDYKDSILLLENAG